MLTFKARQILTQAAKKTYILANFMPPITAARYSLETQQCDHFQGSADTNPGSQKKMTFWRILSPQLQLLDIH